jgi:hypothetical protein
MRIGLDFDNTIIAYGDVFLAAAKERGLIADNFQGGKQAVRDAIRLLPDGELAWQRLQGHVYGRGIGGASMYDGVEAFLRRCRAQGRPVAIVSHKTRYGHHDPSRVDLRAAALDWMRSRGIVGAGEFSIPPGQIFFEDTRHDKLARIAALGCTHFIDDLEEVLLDPDFPARVTRILFSGQKASMAQPPYAVCRTWGQIERQVFGCGG